MKFSERYGYTPVRTALQIEHIDEALTNRLWNIVGETFFVDAPKFSHGSHNWLSNFDRASMLFDAIWHDHFKKPTDTIPTQYKDALNEVRNHFFNSRWYDPYNFLQFLAEYLRDEPTAQRGFVGSINRILKEEVAGYRFVGDQITQITAEEEIAAVEQALGVPDSLKAVREHLKQSLIHLSNKQSPDYRNSIKESISAVESLCGIIAKNDQATLGTILKTLEKTAQLHPALKEAFQKLYGYTSDADGIRHSMMDEPNLDQEDAKFMLVSCSAFVNYLIVKAHKAGIAL
jgi:AbiJ N-terminal domain 4